jgi:membrane fusion protein (multidrug efflux system)
LAPPENGKKGNGKKKVIGVVIAVMVLGLVGSVLGYIRYRSTHVITDDAYVDGDIYPVSAQISGKVAEVLVGPNQRVEAGEALVRLDRRDIEADLAVAKLNLEVVKNQVAGQRMAIEVVASQTNALNAQKELLDKEKDRFSTLLREQHVATDEYDRVKAQWDAVNSQIEAAQNQRKQIEAVLGDGDTQGSVSAVRLAEAQVKKIELMLEHTVIAAPAAGYITRKNVQAGQVVSPGQPLLSVVPLSDIWITANYKETDLNNVRPGQKVVFKIDAYPGEKFNGEVLSIMAGTGSAFSLLPPENATGNYIKVVQRIPVRIKISSPEIKDHPLRIGMSVVPVILTEE